MILLEIYRDIFGPYDDRGLSLALGYFDGVHIGHQQVIKSALRCKDEMKTGVLTFSSHPLLTINGSAPSEIIDTEEKENIIEGMGADCMYVLDFASVREYTAADFIDILAKRMNIKMISCGKNFSIGSDRAGSDELAKICKRRGINLSVSDIMTYNGLSVSSTRIREAVKEGDMLLANSMLGRPFGFKAEVITGDKRGRSLGFPTINQKFPNNIVLPKYGVYISLINVDGSWLPGVTNIGLRPTYSVDYPLSETHIIGYSGDLYGKTIKLQLFDFLREERKFNSADDLVNTVNANIAQAKQWYENHYDCSAGIKK